MITTQQLSELAAAFDDLKRARHQMVISHFTDVRVMELAEDAVTRMLYQHGDGLIEAAKAGIEKDGVLVRKVIQAARETDAALTIIPDILTAHPSAKLRVALAELDAASKAPQEARS